MRGNHAEGGQRVLEMEPVSRLTVSVGGLSSRQTEAETVNLEVRSVREDELVR